MPSPAGRSHARPGGQASDQLKAEIEQTREEMGDTVEALAYKADVPTRAKDWLGEKKHTVVSKVSGASSKVGERTPDSQDVKRGASRAKRTAERNPLGLAIAGAAAGFIAGLVTPSTRIEDERIGPVSDELKSTPSRRVARRSSEARPSPRRRARLHWKP